MGRVSGKVALISGGARGMGASHARLLVAEGAKVVIGDILDEDGRKTAEELGDAARYVHLDVTNAADWDAAVNTAVTEFGGLDVLVNNAGIANFGHIEDYSFEQWNTIVNINLNGVFLGIKSAIPALKESAGGSIINISSTAGLQGFVELPGYTATKYAVRGLSKSAALDLGKYGIRVNSVHPGVIKTPMTEGMENPMNHVALHRMGEAQEVSQMVLFLASDDSSFSSGAEFVVDGGETAGLANY
ncbi:MULTISPECIES: glucose 1-dehydrogenase [unclassified Arthrobacter]|uniref:glucose 1-dehydrogenase n=1 Tax=unclassified Arthrobacter TaxID=235627 RepID=UPI001D151450|nr:MULTISPECIES: glucose 1-dehydrogenase [unclassified Arthrobacter]MCC3275499.1 glucose 1-dehydrogenase [Arthrobacter sp. zg-Y20]MCC9176940.1 glucose 1-dehydrogenase [Arthrobacter sp. zg-Y750]MDK1315656.1 glucose 1-dehydrogenase [Arthrobacter sp. zg.Y20]MDK1326351.1 glucose 1-dehydrogenase [Arthrobacter sp. zg-Y1143]WIB06066.1 glucose 1-dehydrogenase [Arthrobacter sp. zg-Y20]